MSGPAVEMSCLRRSFERNHIKLIKPKIRLKLSNVECIFERQF